MRKAVFPLRSMEAPISRPGMLRMFLSRAAKKAACGPPNPIGTPNLCELPMTTSAPNSPGGLSKTRLIGSDATVTMAPNLCHFSISFSIS